MTLGSTQPLNRNEYKEYFLAGKGGRCVGLTTLPPCLEIWERQSPGTLRACPGIALYKRRSHIFHKSRRHLKIPGPRVTCSMLHTENAQMLRIPRFMTQTAVTYFHKRYWYR